MVDCLRKRLGIKARSEMVDGIYLAGKRIDQNRKRSVLWKLFETIRTLLRLILA